MEENVFENVFVLTYLINRHKHSTKSRLFSRDSDFFENGGFFVTAHSV